MGSSHCHDGLSHELSHQQPHELMGDPLGVARGVDGHSLGIPHQQLAGLMGNPLS